VQELHRKLANYAQAQNRNRVSQLDVGNSNPVQSDGPKRGKRRLLEADFRPCWSVAPGRNFGYQ